MNSHRFALLVIFTFLYTFDSFSQKIDSTTFTSDQFHDLKICLAGKVKSLVQISFEIPSECDTVVYNFNFSGIPTKIYKSGSILKSVYSFNDGKIISESNYVKNELKTEKKLNYDELGRLIEIKYYKNRPNLESTPNELYYKETFKYNTSGLITSHTIDNISSNVYHKWIYTYNTKGNKIEDGSCEDYKGIEKSNDCKYKPLEGYKYNEKGQLLMDFLIGEWHPESKATYYRYDKSGNKVEAKGYRIKNDTTLDYIYTYQYNKSGMIVREEEKFGNYRFIGFDNYKITETSYDSFQNITQKKFITDSNITLKIIKYVYSYDTFGNWFEKTKYEGTNENDLSKVMTIKQIIEYF